jgi:superoxide dismutase, Cu-Zn family
MTKAAVIVAGSALLFVGCAGMEAGPTATVRLEPRSGSKVSGQLKFVEVGEKVHITGLVTGHTPGPKGIHIQEKGDCSDDKAVMSGGHFNPHGGKHGGATTRERHAGDLGHLHFGADGTAKVDITVEGISLSRDKADGVIGRAVVVHAQADDLMSDPTGNAGARVACGLIGG